MLTFLSTEIIIYNKMRFSDATYSECPPDYGAGIAPSQKLITNYQNRSDIPA